MRWRDFAGLKIWFELSIALKTGIKNGA